MAAAAALGPLLEALGVGGAGAAAGGAAEGAAGGLATEQLLNKLIDRMPQGGEGGGRAGGTRFGDLASTGKTIAFGSSFGEKIGDAIKFGPLGIVVGDLTRRFKAVATIPQQFIDWGDALKESKRHLMAFNGVIAVALVESERRAIVRQIGEGRRVGASTEFLTEGLDDLKDAVQPLKDLFSNGLNLLVGVAARITTIGVTIAKFTPLLGGILEAQKLLAKIFGDNEQPAFFRFLDGVQKGGLGEFDRKPQKQPRGFRQ